MLDIKDLNKDFHKHTVLQHLSLHLEGNELIYIHGMVQVNQHYLN